LKLVFFDIDGTLWDFRSIIPDSTIEAIKKLQEGGHMAFINTGRTRGYVTNKKLLDIGFDGIISGCGTRIELHGNIVYDYLLTKEQAVRAVETVRRYGFRPILEGPEHLYMDYEDFKDDTYGRKVMRDLGDNRRSVTDNFGQWKISKLSCDTMDCEREGCFRELQDEFDFIPHNSNVVEIIPKGFGKGRGIKTLCEILKLDVADTIAIGDGANDIDMFEAAGFSVAMGSGAQQAIERADYVTSGLKEDGIYRALEHLGLI